MLFRCIFLSYRWLLPVATAQGLKGAWALQTECALSALFVILGSSSVETYLQCGENVHCQTYKEMNLWLHLFCFIPQREVHKCKWLKLKIQK